MSDEVKWIPRVFVGEDKGDSMLEARRELAQSMVDAVLGKGAVTVDMRRPKPILRVVAKPDREP